MAADNFLASDGYTWSGIFTNGAERAQRASRVSGNALALNGGGGEIWRNFFYLLDRPYSPREILWSFYSQFDPETCTSLFDEEAYFRKLEEKLVALIGYPHPALPRPLVEWLYHHFRCRSWDGRINNINNTYGYVALPFLERPLTEHASVIPTGGVQVMNELFQLDRVSDPAQMARILTLEYLVRQFEGRIRVDFDHSSSPDYKKCAA